MDLLAGYGSDNSDSDSDEQPPPATTHTKDGGSNKYPLLSSAVPAPSYQSTKPSFTSFLPPPQQANASSATATRPAAEPLPSDFFDLQPSPVSKPSSLPPDFFEPAKPAPSPAPITILPEVGPSRPLPPPKFDDDLPAPSSGLLSALPAPKTRRVVTLNVASKLLSNNPKASLGNDDEDLRPKKKVKPASGKSGLLDFLPAPRYSALGSIDHDTPTTHHTTTSHEPQPAAEPEPDYSTMYSNEAYRADATDPSYTAYDYSVPYAPDAATTYPNPYPTADPTPYPSTDAAYHQHPTVHPTAHPASALLHPGPAATSEEIDIFEQALKAECERVARTGGQPTDVKFVELNQEQLKYVAPAAKESHDALREALGSEYALEIRSQAKQYMGSKHARRRHQIGTLYHNAKMMELELMEKRTQSAKSKKETAAKYGW